jgi:hypothetical protein
MTWVGGCDWRSVVIWTSTRLRRPLPGSAVCQTRQLMIVLKDFVSGKTHQPAVPG